MAASGRSTTDGGVTMGNLLRMTGVRSARDRYLSELRSIYGTTTLELPDPDFALLSDPEIYVKMERDPVIYGALDFRLKSVIGQTWHIESASDEPADKDAAALVEEMLSGIKKFQQARLLVFRGALLMGRGYGWLVGGRKQVSQIGGRDVRGAWLPREIKAEDKRRFQYVPTHFEDARGNKRIGQKLQFSPLTLEGQRWIDLTGSDLRALVTMTYEDRADRLGMGQGLGVPLYHWFRQKALAWRDWAQASERWAQGVVAMKINQDREGSDTNQEIADAALDEIDEMRSRHVLIYGEGEEVQLFETSGRGQQISADQIEKIDRDIIRVLTGSVRPMGGDSDTGARAQSETEQDTTDVIIDYDRAQHDEAITETVVRCVWELNTPLFAQFGLGKAKMPRFSTSKDRRQDPQNAVTVIGQALASQIPLRKVDVYEALGMQQPSENDEVFEGQQPAPGGAPGLPFGGEHVASFGEWDEEKHKRDEGGKFKPKGGGDDGGAKKKEEADGSGDGGSDAPAQSMEPRRTEKPTGRQKRAAALLEKWGGQVDVEGYGTARPYEVNAFPVLADAVLETYGEQVRGSRSKEQLPTAPERIELWVDRAVDPARHDKGQVFQDLIDIATGTKDGEEWQHRALDWIFHKKPGYKPMLKRPSEYAIGDQSTEVEGADAEVTDAFLAQMERLAGMTPAERDAELAMYAKKPDEEAE